MPSVAYAASDAWTQVALPLPADTTSLQMDGVDCPATGDCTAVGWADVDGTNEELAFDETNGNWQSAEIPSPDGTSDGQPQGPPDALSCTAGGDCVALGTYPGSDEYMVSVEQGGSWSSFGDGDTYSAETVACQPNAACTVAGAMSYTTANYGQTDAFAGTISGNGFDAVRLPVPTGTPTVASDTIVDLDPSLVSCPASGDCTIVGIENYEISTTNGPESQASDFVATGSGTSWTAQMIPTPGAPSAEANFLFSDEEGLSCPTASSCIADGAADNEPSSGLTQTFADAEQTDDSYTEQSLSVPASESGTSSDLTSSGCIGAGDCVIGGHTVGTSGDGEGFLEELDDSTWSYFTPTAPSDASGTPNQAFPWVSCSANGLCAATGGYNTTTGTRQLGLYTGSGTTWQTQSAGFTGLPTNGSNELYQEGVSCAPDGGCATTGFYGGNPYTGYIFTTNPELQVSVSTPVDQGATPPNLGDTVPVTVKVTASDSDQGDITGISFTGSELTWSPSSSLTSTDDTSPSPFNLAPGASQTFTVDVKVAALGTINLNSAVSGTDSQGNTVTASGSDTLTPQGGLNVTVTTSAPKNTVNLLNAADGSEIAQSLTATITIQNPLGVAVSNVSLVDPMTVEKLQSGAVTTPLEETGKPSPNPPQFSSIGPGDSEQVTVPFSAVADGTAEIDALVNYSNPFASGMLSSTGDVQVLVNPGLLLAIDYHMAPGESGLVTSGGQFSVLGTLRNLTNSVVEHIDPLQPTLTGNVGGLNPFDVDKPPPANEYVLAWSGALDAGDTLSFQAIGQTVQGLGSKGTVSYSPTGTVDLPDGSSRVLEPTDILQTAPAGNQLAVSIDDSVPAPADSSAISVVGNFTLAATEAESQWLQNNWSSLKAIGSGAVDLLKTPHILSAVQTAEYLVDYYTSLSSSEQDDYMTQVASDILEQTDEYGKTLAAVKAAVVSTVEGWENQLVAAWQKDDWNSVASLLGQAASNTLLEAAVWFVHLPAGANVIRAADAARAAELADKAATTVGELTQGENLLTKAGSPLRTIFGLDDGQIAQLTDLAKDENVQIAIRYRSPKAAYWIEQFGALPKPEAIKLKSVTDLDYMFLGYRRGDEALAVLKKPISEAQVEANLAAHDVTSPDIRQAVLDRWAARKKEYKQLLPLYREYEQTGVQVGFDYGAQGITSQPSVFTRRAFRLAPVKGESDYWVLEMANQSGRLKPITGDIDAVAIAESDGSILPEAKRIDLYNAMQQINDAQHGATFDWFKNGELGSQTQLDLLAAHHPGKQLLAVFDPSGNVTAQYIDPALTVYDEKTGTGRIWFTQGMRMPEALPVPSGSVSLPADTTPGAGIRPAFVSPASWGLGKPSGSTQQTVRHTNLALAAADDRKLPFPSGTVAPTPAVLSLAACTWRFTLANRAAVAYPTYENGSGGLEVWSRGRGWRKLNASECRRGARRHADGPLGSDRILNVLPESSVSVGASAGAASLAINAVSAVAPGVHLDHPAWFAAGDKIVIDPGEPDQEIAKITSVDGNSLRLATRLKHDHEAAEMVAVYAS